MAKPSANQTGLKWAVVTSPTGWQLLFCNKSEWTTHGIIYACTKKADTDEITLVCSRGECLLHRSVLFYARGAVACSPPRARARPPFRDALLYANCRPFHVGARQQVCADSVQRAGCCRCREGQAVGRALHPAAQGRDSGRERCAQCIALHARAAHARDAGTSPRPRVRARASPVPSDLPLIMVWTERDTVFVHCFCPF
jgi:hypothetical protein